jgi:hypothetical protein
MAVAFWQSFVTEQVHQDVVAFCVIAEEAFGPSQLFFLI